MDKQYVRRGLSIPISILCPALYEFGHVWDNPCNSTIVVCLFEQIEVIDLYKQNYSLVSVSIDWESN
mgnify:CR=1 FL=1